MRNAQLAIGDWRLVGRWTFDIGHWTDASEVRERLLRVTGNRIAYCVLRIAHRALASVLVEPLAGLSAEQAPGHHPSKQCGRGKAGLAEFLVERLGDRSEEHKSELQ